MCTNHYKYTCYQWNEAHSSSSFSIILAIMFNEIKDSKLGKIRGLFQGILYIPHFYRGSL